MSTVIPVFKKAYVNEGLIARVVCYGTVEELQTLYDLGVRDMETQYRLDSRLYTPVQWAVYTKSFEKLKWLAEHGAKLDGRIDNKPILQYAVKMRMKNIADFLKAKGCPFF